MYKWNVSLIDRSSGGYGEQDLTARFDAENSHLVGNAFDRIAQSDVRFKLKAADEFRIDSFGELWAGWRDDVTHEWDGSRAVFGGFITQHVGSFYAGYHLFDCTVSNHNILFDRTEVLTWPTDPSAVPYGFPPGFAVRDWLIGLYTEGNPYDGIIPAHFQHFSNGGVDPIFDTIILDEAYIPAQGDSELFGHFGFMSVRALLDEIVKVARAKALADGNDVKPSYFWRLVAVGTALVPQFCFIDLNSATATADATYSLTPTGDELPLEYPYTHTRNAQPVRTRVTVKGEGADVDGLIYYSYLKSEGNDRYPTYYQKRDGWAGAPINESTINTRGAATRYATAIGDAIWGPEGTITFPTNRPRQAGERIALDFPPDGMTGDVLPVFPLLEVEGTLVPYGNQLTLGQRPRALEDILVPRPDAPMPTTDAGTGAGAAQNVSAAGVGYGGANVAGAPRTRPVVDRPVHSDQNVIKPVTRDVVAQIIQMTAQALPAGLVDTPPPAGNSWEIRLPDTTLTVWADKYGTAHKQKLAFSWQADGTATMTAAERMTIHTAVQPANQTGVTFSYKVWRLDNSTPTVTLAFEVLPGEEIQVTAAGVSGHASLTLVTGDPL